MYTSKKCFTQILKRSVYSNIASFVNNRGLHLNLYCLREIIANDKKNLNFYIQASKLKNDLRLVGLSIFEFPGKCQCNQI